MWKKERTSVGIFRYNIVKCMAILWALLWAARGSVVYYIVWGSGIALFLILEFFLYQKQRKEEDGKEKPLGKQVFLGAPLLLEIILFEGYISTWIKNLEGAAKSSAAQVVFFIGILACILCYHDFCLIERTVHDKQRKLYLWVSGIIGGVAFVYIYIFLVRMGVR